jgi:hypothetical protein
MARLLDVSLRQLQYTSPLPTCGVSGVPPRPAALPSRRSAHRSRSRNGSSASRSSEQARTADLVRELNEGALEADVGGLDYEMLGRDLFVLAASPRHPLVKKTTPTLAWRRGSALGQALATVARVIRTAMRIPGSA